MRFADKSQDEKGVRMLSKNEIERLLALNQDLLKDLLNAETVDCSRMLELMFHRSILKDELIVKLQDELKQLKQAK